MIEDPMENNEIQSVLMNALSLQEVHVSGDGSHFQVIAVGELFDGMSRVKKQQTVYGPLMEYIADNRMRMELSFRIMDVCFMIRLFMV